MNNSVADLAIRIKNGYMSGKPAIIASFSKLNVKIIEILKKEKYIDNFVVTEESGKKSIQIELLYDNTRPAVSQVTIVSKPGRRMYIKSKYVKPILGGLGISLISTPKGVITDKEARKLKIGGEVLFKIW